METSAYLQVRIDHENNARPYYFSNLHDCNRVSRSVTKKQKDLIVEILRESGIIIREYRI